MKVLFLIPLIIYQGCHVFSESQQTQPQPAGQTAEVEQTPQRQASTFLGQMIANLINYKLRWLSILADRLAGNSTGWPSTYFAPTANMANPTTLHFTPAAQGIPTKQQSSPTTASNNAHLQVHPAHSAPATFTSHASPITHTLPSTLAAHSPTMHTSPTTSHSAQPDHSPQKTSGTHISPQTHSPLTTSHLTQPVHSPQTTSGTHASPQMHSSPSNSHSAQPVHSPQTTSGTHAPAQTLYPPLNSHPVQSAHKPPSSVSHSPSNPQIPQPVHSSSTHLAPVNPLLSPTSSDYSTVPLSDTNPESIPTLDSALPLESFTSPEIAPVNTFSAEQMSPPVVSSNPLSPSLSEPGFSTEPEVSTTSQVAPAPAPVLVPGTIREGVPKPPPLSTPLSELQPPAQSALDGY